MARDEAMGGYGGVAHPPMFEIIRYFSMHSVFGQCSVGFRPMFSRFSTDVQSFSRFSTDVHSVFGGCSLGIHARDAHSVFIKKIPFRKFSVPTPPPRPRPRITHRIGKKQIFGKTSTIRRMLPICTPPKFLLRYAPDSHSLDYLLQM